MKEMKKREPYYHNYRPTIEQIVPFIPTAENLAKWAFEQVQPHIQTAYGNRLRLVAMHVRETPKSWASWYE